MDLLTVCKLVIPIAASAALKIIVITPVWDFVEKLASATTTPAVCNVAFFSNNVRVTV